MGYPHNQGSYTSGKCQGNLLFFKVRELSGNSVAKMSGNFTFQSDKARIFGPDVSFLLNASNFRFQYCLGI